MYQDINFMNIFYENDMEALSQYYQQQMPPQNQTPQNVPQQKPNQEEQPQQEDNQNINQIELHKQYLENYYNTKRLYQTLKDNITNKDNEVIKTIYYTLISWPTIPKEQAKDVYEQLERLANIELMKIREGYVDD